MKKTIPVPASVRRQALQGLALRRTFRRGGTSVGLATARLLAERRAISLAKVRHISRYFPRHAGDRLDRIDPPSNGLIAWKLWGGDPGRAWSERVVRDRKRWDT